jgi:nitroimidazol reductase NimA-like FMN-containing flavoprotein (pyridoxamine 5'-phosphate oxidase superfamily)
MNGAGGGEEMRNTLVLYESRYGFTKMAALQAALVLGPGKCMRLSEFNDNKQEWDLIVLLIPVYYEKLDEGAVENIKNNLDRLKKGKIVLFCTCLAKEYAKRYLQPVSELLGSCVIFQEGIAGNLILNQLDQEDRGKTTSFFKSAGLKKQDYLCFDQDWYVETLLGIKEWKDNPTKAMDEKKILDFSEEFLINHDTCSLSTGYGKRVRATPIEYRYKNGFLYILSEGGEKFANILLSPKVSVAVFNEFQGMNRLRGMQIKGTAEIIETGSEEYREFLAMRNLKYENVMRLPASLYLIKITICRIEFLWSGFRDMGVDVKQILTFSNPSK